MIQCFLPHRLSCCGNPNPNPGGFNWDNPNRRDFNWNNTNSKRFQLRQPQQKRFQLRQPQQKRFQLRQSRMQGQMANLKITQDYQDTTPESLTCTMSLLLVTAIAFVAHMRPTHFSATPSWESKLAKSWEETYPVQTYAPGWATIKGSLTLLPSWYRKVLSKKYYELNHTMDCLQRDLTTCRIIDVPSHSAPSTDDICEVIIDTEEVQIEVVIPKVIWFFTF